MARKALLECTFLIPVRRDRDLSDGKVHDPEAWEWLETQLFNLFGGSTCNNETVSGSYRDPDTHERVWDESWKYAVAVPRRQVPRLRLVLQDGCSVFQQKCIYLTVAARVEFVVRQEHEQP